MNKTTSTLITSQFQSQILQQLLQNQAAHVEGRKSYPKTFEEYKQDQLENYMSREKGRKRVRKKKALRKLKKAWQMYSMVRPIATPGGMLDYGEIGRQLFPVQPLPGGAEPIYSKHVDNEYGTIRQLIKDAIDEF
jgi:hypothetical protein